MVNVLAVAVILLKQKQDFAVLIGKSLQTVSLIFAKTTFTAATVKKLLSGQSVKMKKLVSKTGKEFEAEVKMKDDPSSQYGPSFDLIFNKK